jgi:hypothetical protein
VLLLFLPDVVHVLIFTKWLSVLCTIFMCFSAMRWLFDARRRLTSMFMPGSLVNLFTSLY